MTSTHNTTQLSDAQVSDLFFNTQHVRYDLAMAGQHSEDGYDSEHAISNGLRPDAEEFAQTYPQFGKDANWYVTEYLDRV